MSRHPIERGSSSPLMISHRVLVMMRMRLHVAPNCHILAEAVQHSANAGAHYGLAVRCRSITHATPHNGSGIIAECVPLTALMHDME